jgi:hypothetical protein
MATDKDLRDLQDLVAMLRGKMVKSLAPQLIQNPQLAEAATLELDAKLDAALQGYASEPPPADGGLASLIGLGPDAASSFDSARISTGVTDYDETVTSERLLALGDLYYIYQHEKIGVFKVVKKLQELFRAGAVRLSSGPGAYGLYRFDRREVLRYTLRDRLAAYRRAFGYGTAPLPPSGHPNMDFHGLFTGFVNEVTTYWRDKRISDVVRERAYDPSFGSVAVVRRAGFDLRNNLKWASYGHINVLRAEVMQALEEAFNILSAPDVRELFGAENGWDVLEEVLTRYFNEPLNTSPRQRMGVAGREIIRWLAEPYVLSKSQVEFETLLRPIAGYAEEWLTSAQAVGVAERRPSARDTGLPWGAPGPVGAGAPHAPLGPGRPRSATPYPQRQRPALAGARPPARPPRNGYRRPPEREYESESEYEL